MSSPHSNDGFNWEAVIDEITRRHRLYHIFENYAAHGFQIWWWQMNQVVLRRKWQSTTGGDGCDDHDYDDDNDEWQWWCPLYQGWGWSWSWYNFIKWMVVSKWCSIEASLLFFSTFRLEMSPSLKGLKNKENQENGSCVSWEIMKFNSWFTGQA